MINICCRLCFAYFIYSWIISTVSCKLLTVPVDTIVQVGDTAQINCSSTLLDSFVWTLTRPGATAVKFFEPATDPKGYIYGSFQDRFSVTKGDDGSQNVLIRNISFLDAGIYTCREDHGWGHSAAANLIVIDKKLECTHNISEDGSISRDICGLNVEPDYINMICSIAYRGTVAPTLLWRQNEGNITSAGNMTSEIVYNSLVASTVVLREIKHLQETRFSCLMEMIIDKRRISTSQLSDISWTSPLITLLLFNYSQNASSSFDTICSTTEVTCRVHFNRSCVYTWIQLSTNVSVSSEVLNPSIFSDWSGIYECRADCQVRGGVCTVRVRTVQAEDCAGVIIIGVLLPTLLVIVAAAFLSLIFYRKKFNKSLEVEISELDSLVPLPSSAVTTFALLSSSDTAIGLSTSPDTAIDLPTSPDTAIDSSISPDTAIDLPFSPVIAIDLPTSPGIAIDLPTSPDTAIKLPTSPAISVDLPTSPGIAIDLPIAPDIAIDLPNCFNAAIELFSSIDKTMELSFSPGKATELPTLPDTDNKFKTLPDTVIENIIVQTFVLMHYRMFSIPSTSNPDNAVYSILMSVCDQWHAIPASFKQRPRWFYQILKEPLLNNFDYYAYRQRLTKKKKVPTATLR